MLYKSCMVIIFVCFLCTLYSHTPLTNKPASTAIKILSSVPASIYSEFTFLVKDILLDLILYLLYFSPQATPFNFTQISQITLIIYLYLNLISFYPFFIEEEVP